MTATDRSAFDAHVARVAPWFAPGDAVMTRLADVHATMAEAREILDTIRPQVERLIELATPALVEIDALCADISVEVYDATDELVDDWELLDTIAGHGVALEAMELGERLAKIDPPVSGMRPVPETGARPRPPKPTAKPLPVEAIRHLAAAGAPVAYPAGAVRDRRDHESPPQSVHFVHWYGEARRDIATRGLSWAEGHLEGLVVASSIPSTYCGEWTGLAHEIHGRPDPLAQSSDAWVERENAAELTLAVPPVLAEVA